MTNSTINTPDDNGYTPLMKAAQIGNMDDVRLLLKAGADPNIQSYDDQSALFVAINYQHIPLCFSLLEAGADPNLKDHFDYTALHLAVCMNNESLIKALLRAGADINAKNVRHETPLMMINERTPEKLITLLIDSGADVHQYDDNGDTALIIAVKNNLLKAVELLIKAGTDVNRVNMDEETAYTLSDNQEITALLLNAGAHTSTRTINHELKNWPPADADFSGLVTTPSGEYPRFYKNDLQWRKDLKREIETLTDINSRNEYGFTPLMRAISLTSTNLVRQLLEAGADIHLKDKNGRTAIMQACAQNMMLRNTTDIITLLLNAGANIHERDNKGDNCLMIATKSRNEDLMRRLILAGANIHETDRNGKSALDYAKESGDDFMFHLPKYVIKKYDESAEKK